MTSHRKIRKAERRTRAALSQQSQVDFNRGVYNGLCELLALVTTEADREIMDIPGPISEGVGNSCLPVDYTRGAIYSAVDALRVALKAGLLGAGKDNHIADQGNDCAGEDSYGTSD
ncbi:MAG: hypothetical protein KKE05_02670 [Nanoarchaeota archaeon]|nr:hypothetical protein [Nanoarchaeota archaeon]